MRCLWQCPQPVSHALQNFLGNLRSGSDVVALSKQLLACGQCPQPVSHALQNFLGNLRSGSDVVALSKQLLACGQCPQPVSHALQNFLGNLRSGSDVVALSKQLLACGQCPQPVSHALQNFLGNLRSGSDVVALSKQLLACGEVVETDLEGHVLSFRVDPIGPGMVATEFSGGASPSAPPSKWAELKAQPVGSPHNGKRRSSAEFRIRSGQPRRVVGIGK